MRTFIALLCSFAAAAQPIRGFNESQAKAQRTLEERFRALPEAARINTYLKRMAAKPHHAGSPASRAVAEYALGLFREWGLKAEIEEFQVFLPYPASRSLKMTSPVTYEAKLKEAAFGEDDNTADEGMLPTFNAYSAAGDVSGELVYVNYGLPTDYAVLKKNGIDVRGKIVIARYGQSWRGVKPKVAAENGAIGCLLYSDPRDDGYYRGDVYPKGLWRPSTGVQRGSVMEMADQVGDPLTPGIGATKEARRIPMEEVRVMQKIPVLPISYEDAQPLLANLGGAVVPEEWKGALPLTYHFGPGPAKVDLSLRFDNQVRPIHDVIVRIPGSEFPEQWIVYGNHHDAWVHGASDPLSGASSLLETGRALAEMMKTGWRPKRTIILALWDAEEFGLIGSTEWVEKHQQELAKKAVAYINSDTTSAGAFTADGSPSLETFLRQAARDQQTPGSKGSIAVSDFAPMGAGSDYVAFVHNAGIASLNFGFSTPMAGVYHTAYDTLGWRNRFADGDAQFTRTFSQLTGTMLLRLAEAPVLPFEFNSAASRTAQWLDDLKKQKLTLPDLKAVETELATLSTAARQFEAAWTGSLNRNVAPARLARVNDLLMLSERALLVNEGLNGRAFYRHALFAPGRYTGYGAKTLPGLREAAEQGNREEAIREAARLAQALASYSARIREAARILAE
jgi:N-acetylated-alpha-linked acidic dipeptidase